MCLLCLKERTSLARPLTSAKCQKESVHGKLVVQHRPKTNKRWNAAAFEQSQFFDHTGNGLAAARPHPRRLNRTCLAPAAETSKRNPATSRSPVRPHLATTTLRVTAFC